MSAPAASMVPQALVFGEEVPPARHLARIARLLEDLSAQSYDTVELVSRTREIERRRQELLKVGIDCPRDISGVKRLLAEYGGT